MNQLIALSDMPENVAGSIIWWRFVGGINWAQLTAKLPTDWPQPQPPTPLNALRRALGLYSPQNSMVRPLDSNDGYAVMRERFVAGLSEAVKNRPAYEHLFTTYFFSTAWDSLKVEFSYEYSKQCDPEAEEQTIRDCYFKAAATLAPSEMASYVVKLLERRLRAVSLRPQGGFYFVPPEGQAEVQQLTDILREVSAGSYRVFTIAAMRSDDAVEAFIDAAVQEANAAIKDMDEQLNEGSLGVRALEGREVALSKVRAKFTYYEQLLQTKEPMIHKAIGDLEARLVAARLVAEQEAK